MIGWYFTNWSVNYWKSLPPGISGLGHGMILKLSLKKLLDKNGYWRCHQLGHVTSLHFTNQKINLRSSLLQKKHVCRNFYIYVKWSLPKVIMFGILSMLITWQVCIYRLVYNLLKISIFLKLIKFFTVTSPLCMHVFYRPLCDLPPIYVKKMNLSQ